MVDWMETSMSPPQPSLDDLRIHRSPKPAASRSILPWTIATISLVAVAVAIAIWWLLRPKAVEVHTAVAREATAAGADRTVLNASGYVTARREATVSSKVTGKVAEVTIEEGMRVKE